MVRGALEAGLGFAAGYPGTPASEVGDSLRQVAPLRGVVFRDSVNEKVALEAAHGASVAGARSLASMKHLGLSYAGDPLATLGYVGVNAGMVVVAAGDPGLHTSPNEQDQRHLARMNGLPVLDPSSPDEARRMARDAFALSEACDLPVLLRITTAVAHCRAVVLGDPLPVGPTLRPALLDPERFVPIPARARRMRLLQEGRLDRARRWAEGSSFVRVTGRGRLGIVATGAPAALVADRIEGSGLGDAVRLLELGMPWPLPEEPLLDLLSSVGRVLVLEELTPFVEDALRALAQRRGIAVEIRGKATGDLPGPFGYGPEVVARALDAFVGGRAAPPRDPPPAPPLPVRPPVLCSGCPHRATFAAVKQVFGEKAAYFNDIGCYTLGAAAPLDVGHVLLCMGSSIAQGAGASPFLDRPAVAFVGDSTFFHSGMPPLLDAVQAGVDLLVVVLDNRVTAMTGFQASPASPPSWREGKAETSIEALCRDLGADPVRVVDPLDWGAAVGAVEELARLPGVRVLVARHECPVAGKHFASVPGPRGARPYAVDRSRCRRCSAAPACGLTPGRAYQRLRVGARLAAPAADATPCTSACPIGMCAQGYVSRAATGDAAGAWALVLRDNALPSVCASVCHRPCEDACGVGGPAVPINEIKGWLADVAEGRPEPSFSAAAPTGRRVAVVGAGPAGLAAARHLALKGHEATVLDGAPAPGGMLSQAIPAWRLPAGRFEADCARVLAAGVTFAGGRSVGRDLPLDALLAGHDAVLVATGAGRGRRLAVPGAELRGVTDALSWLRHLRAGPIPGGRAPSRPYPARGDRVVVVGGGDVAIDAARAALREGASRVTVVAREPAGRLPAGEEQARLARDEGAEVLGGLDPTSIKVQGGALLAAFRPAGDAGAGTRAVEISADAVVVAIGQEPDLGWSTAADPAFPQIPVSDDGTVRAGPDGAVPGVPGLWVAGDVAGARRTVVDAMASGLAAARAIDRALGGDGRAHPAPAASGPWDAVPPPSLARAAATCRACGVCATCSACLDLLGCPALSEVDGAIEVDRDLCNGCGLCGAICPHGALIPEPDRRSLPVLGPQGVGG
ncbi:FAD-dependent oxidoreductase [Myxococcota bacterium]|nr:FAD-dependent oxidoreductase [Myxococcota bacterium]